MVGNCLLTKSQLIELTEDRGKKLFHGFATILHYGTFTVDYVPAEKGYHLVPRLKTDYLSEKYSV